MNNIPVPTPKSVGLILSYECNAECAHCMYACGPEWDRDLISTSRLERTLSKLSEHIISSPRGAGSIGLNQGLHLTGGEPFLHYDRLLQATRMAEDKGIPSIFAETNSFWCSDDQTTRKKLNELRRAGLDGIMISVNPFYLEYIPFENTKRAVSIGREIFGSDAIVYQAEYLRKFNRMDVQGTLDLESYLQSEGAALRQNVEFFLSGRAPYEVPGHDIPGLQPKPASRWINTPCRPPLLREWHNHVDNYGNYVPGYCGGLSFGDIGDLNSLLTNGLAPHNFPILSHLVEDDFEGLLKMAKNRGYSSLDSGYYSKCHLCEDIRAFLHSTGNFTELQPDQFYQHLPVDYQN